MLKIKIHWQIIIALVLAVLVGLYLTDYVKYVTWMGDIFLRALKMIIVPLILTSIVSGVVNIGDAQNLGKLGLKTITYYIVTSLIAILIGLTFVNLIQPGVGADLGLRKSVEGLSATQNDLWGIFIRMIPINIFESLEKSDILAIIIFSILIGYFIIKVADKYRNPLVNLFNGGFEVMMALTSFIIKFAPIGIFGIVVKVVADQASNKQVLIDAAQRLGLYMIVVLAGLIVHAFIILPLITKIFGKVNPWKHLRNMSTPLLTAFSTSSSSATLPLTMEAVEVEDGVSNKISSFVLPLGATVNMNGTALYECAAVMFISQAYGIHLTVLQQFTVVITALLAAIGAAGIPMAGLVMMAVVLQAVGLPLEGIGLILAPDRLLDMCRTAVNVWGDTCGAVIIAKTEGEELKV
jgi:Na+/H+-dicarboxylate symporter